MQRQTDKNKKQIRNENETNCVTKGNDGLRKKVGMEENTDDNEHELEDEEDDGAAQDKLNELRLAAGSSKAKLRMKQQQVVCGIQESGSSLFTLAMELETVRNLCNASFPWSTQKLTLPMLCSECASSRLDQDEQTTHRQSCGRAHSSGSTNHWRQGSACANEAQSLGNNLATKATLRSIIWCFTVSARVLV